jgi:hypothetical protein
MVLKWTTGATEVSANLVIMTLLIGDHEYCLRRFKQIPKLTLVDAENNLTSRTG